MDPPHGSAWIRAGSVEGVMDPGWIRISQMASGAEFFAKNKEARGKKAQIIESC